MVGNIGGAFSYLPSLDCGLIVTTTTQPNLKGNMHHKYDLIWKDAFPNAHFAARLYFLEKFHHKQRGLKNVNFVSAHFSSSLGSLFLLFRLILPPPNTTAGRLCKEEENEPEEEENEPEEEEKWAWGEKMSQQNASLFLVKKF